MTGRGWLTRWPWFIAAQMYSREAGAVYLGRWSFHWALRGPVIVTKEGKVETLRERPWRCIHVYRGLRTIFKLRLWPHYAYCAHGFRKDSAWWHRCDYVTADNPDGRPSDRELFPEDYDEHGIHYMDRTCFCDLKPEYAICAMHPEDDE
jgi:hypothetical protein